MKTEKLSGALLDYWVARAEGHPLSAEVDHSDTVFIGYGNGDLEPFSPSSDWAQGGPIIERENIQVSNHATSPPGMTFSLWYAVLPVCQPKRCATRRGHGYMDGDTPLIAAMRCYVASVYGEEVPDHA